MSLLPAVAAMASATTALLVSTVTGTLFPRASLTTCSSCESLRGSAVAASSIACLALLAAGLGSLDSF
jgi:hypothetical protein